MDTHSMIFVTIDKLVSPSSSVNRDPLDDSADHWQPRFSAKFPRCRTSEGGLARPLRTKDLSGLGCSTRAVKPWDLLARSCHLRDKMLTHRQASIRHVANGLGGPRFCWSRNRFVA